MTKLETVRALPSATAPAIARMIQLEQTINHLDHNLAIAVRRIEESQDAQAAELLPLIDMREQLRQLLTDSASRLKNTIDSAQGVEAEMSEALSALREQVRLLRFAAESTKPRFWKYLGVALLSAVLATGLGQLLQQAETTMAATPIVTIDTQTLSEQIIDKWNQRHLER